MVRVFFLLLVVVYFAKARGYSQGFKVLHYTETSGFDHLTRNVSFSMFTQLGLENNFTVVDDSTGGSFNTLNNLLKYQVVVFSNTSGDAILDANQRQNFEQYIGNGGNVVSIHSASDTYRHSTANGNNTGAWDFYPALIGASVQQNPNHVLGTPYYNMHSAQQHILLINILEPWYKAEEYYYWESGYFDSVNNHILLEVETTVGPNGLKNSYDSSRATTWYKILPGSNRIFYTSLGHSASNYSSDSTFRILIRNAVLWAAGILQSIEVRSFPTMDSYPNPFSNYLDLKSKEDYGMQLLDVSGKQVYEVSRQKAGILIINTSDLEAGVYFLKVKFKNSLIVRKLLKVM